VARAIQCFIPGIPQIYYVGLLAGGNDMDLLRRTRVGRDINRHYYSAAELQEALTRAVVRSQLALLRFRNTHAAFHGTFHVSTPTADAMEMVWKNGGEFARLEVDLTEMRAVVTCSAEGAGPEGARAWQSPPEAQV
jgi:sucrose phosphorylase